MIMIALSYYHAHVILMVLAAVTKKSRHEPTRATEHFLFSQATRAWQLGQPCFADLYQVAVLRATAMYMSAKFLKDLPDRASVPQVVHRRHFSSMQACFVYVFSFSGTPALTSTSLSSMLKRGSHCETSARGTMPLPPETSAPGSSRQLLAWSLKG